MSKNWKTFSPKITRYFSVIFMKTCVIRTILRADGVVFGGDGSRIPPWGGCRFFRFFPFFPFFSFFPPVGAGCDLVKIRRKKSEKKTENEKTENPKIDTLIFRFFSVFFPVPETGRVVVRPACQGGGARIFFLGGYRMGRFWTFEPTASSAGSRKRCFKRSKGDVVGTRTQ